MKKKNIFLPSRTRSIHINNNCKTVMNKKILFSIFNFEYIITTDYFYTVKR